MVTYPNARNLGLQSLKSICHTNLILVSLYPSLKLWTIYLTLFWNFTGKWTIKGKKWLEILLGKLRDASSPTWSWARYPTGWKKIWFYHLSFQKSKLANSHCFTAFTYIWDRKIQQIFYCLSHCTEMLLEALQLTQKKKEQGELIIQRKYVDLCILY